MLNIFLIVGLMLLLGFLFGRILRRMGFTSILGYLLAGIIIGPVMSPILHSEIPAELSGIVTSITLSFVAYTIGLNFSMGFIRRMGKKTLIILITEVVITAVAVFIFVYSVSHDVSLSLILASLSPATAPAGTVAILRDFRSKGALTDTIMAVVGLDDAAAIVIFSVGIAWTKITLGGAFSIGTSIINPLWEIMGAVAIGLIGGLALSYYTKRFRSSSDPIFVLSVASAITCWGVADVLSVSPILTCMILGATLINTNRDIGNLSNNLIDSVMTPVFIIFFAVIGTEIMFGEVSGIWLIVILYCLGRTAGKISGSWLGGFVSGSESKIRRYLGFALADQAGVAIGLSFLAARELVGYPLGNTIITIIAISTALFQVFAPLGVQYSIKKSGEARIESG